MADDKTGVLKRALLEACELGEVWARSGLSTSDRKDAVASLARFAELRQEAERG